MVHKRQTSDDEEQSAMTQEQLHDVLKQLDDKVTLGESQMRRLRQFYDDIDGLMSWMSDVEKFLNLENEEPKEKSPKLTKIKPKMLPSKMAQLQLSPRQDLNSLVTWLQNIG